MKDNASYFKRWYLKLSKDDIRFGEQQTKKELKFIEHVLEPKKGQIILDLACGTGRHLIPLSRKYRMFGIDSSREALRILKENLKKTMYSANVTVGDMRKIPHKDFFDFVIMMSSSFGYFKDDKENIKVLRGIYDALKPGGKLLFDLKNQTVVAKNTPPHQHITEHDREVFYTFKIDLKTSLSRMSMTFIDRKTHKKQKASFILKLYPHKKLIKMLQRTGFQSIDSFGGVTNPKKAFDEESSSRIVLLAKK